MTGPEKIAEPKRRKVTRSKNQLESWEIALIKALAATGRYNNQEILALFSSAARTINSGRISEIVSKTKHAEIPVASDEQLRTFLAQPRSDLSRAELHDVVLNSDPLSISTIRHHLPVSADGSRLEVPDETDFVEWKRWDKGIIPKLARALVALANNKGGYVVIGVDNDRSVLGIPAEAPAYDPGGLSTHLKATYQPTIHVNRADHQIGDKTVWVFYVKAADRKPVQCIKDFTPAGISQGDIFFRYRGSSDRIAPAELETLIVEREQRAVQRWEGLFRQVKKVGVENAAVLNTLTGQVVGPGGAFLISEELLPKIAFIREGQFSEIDGAPALKLVGEVRSIDQAMVQPIAVADAADEPSILKAFFSKAHVANPEPFLRAMLDKSAQWVPVLFMLRSAGLTQEQASNLVTRIETNYVDRRQLLLDRIAGRRRPGVLRPTAKGAALRASLIAGDAVKIIPIEQAKIVLSGILTLNKDEADLYNLLEIVASCFAAHFANGIDGNTLSLLRRAASHLDVEMHAYA